MNGEAALGLLEVYGFAAAVAVADEMAKAAPVAILGRLDIGDGLVTIVASGGVSAVAEAVGAGERLASSRVAFRAAVVLGRPAAGITELFFSNQSFPPGSGGAAPPGGVKPRVAVNPVRVRRRRRAQT